MIWPRRAISGLREMHSGSIVAIYHKWPRYAFNNFETGYQIL